MKEIKEVIVTERIYNLYEDEYDVTAEALDRAFSDLKVLVNPAYEFAEVVEGMKGNSTIFLGNFSPLFKKVERYKSSGVVPEFPFGQKVEFENFFKKDLDLQNIPVLVKKKYFDKTGNKRHKFQIALKYALSKNLKKHCKAKVVNEDHMEDCESCKRPMFKETHHSVRVFDEKNLCDMEILPKTNKFVQHIEKLIKGEKLEDVVVELRVPQMFLKGQ